MSELRQTGPSYFINRESSKIQVGGWTRDTEVKPESGSYKGYPGLSWYEFTYKGINKEDEDGVLGELQPGARTPVEMVATDMVFLEVPIEGKLTLLAMDPEGNIFVDQFDQDPSQASYAIEMTKGWIFCWFADKNQTSPARFLETEKPGFKEGDLPIIEPKTQIFNGHPISEKFWEEFDRLAEKN